MDDILSTLKQQFVQTKFKEINALHPNLIFTSEVEIKGKISFPDLCIYMLMIKSVPPGIVNLLFMNFHELAPRVIKNLLWKVL